MMGDYFPTRRFGAMLALTVLCLSAAVLATGASADVDAHVTIEEAGVEQARGDVPTFTLSVPQGESVAVVVDGPGGSRELNLSDASGDGRVTLSINSYLAGPRATASEVYGVADGDRLSVDGDATGRLPIGEYRVAAYADGNDGDPADTAGLSLTEAGLGNATVLAAPNGSRNRLDSRAAIRRARVQGWLTPTTEVAIGDTLVLRLTVPGVAGAVANESGGTDEARFERLLARSNTSILLSEQMPGPSRHRYHLSLDASNTTTVVADPDNDTYYVAADLTALPLASGDSPAKDELSFSDYAPHDRTTHVPRFLVDNRSRLNPGDISEEVRTGQFVTVGPDAVVTYPAKRDGTLQVAPSSDQVVAGWTTVAPGSTVTVELSNGEGEPFPTSRTVRVVQERPPDADGAVYRYRAEFDLSEAGPGTTFDVDIRSNGTGLSVNDRWYDGYQGHVDPALATTAVGTATATTTETAPPSPTSTSTPTPSPTATTPFDPGVTPTGTSSPTATAKTTAGDGPGFGALAALLGLTAPAAIGVCRTGGRSQ